MAVELLRIVEPGDGSESTVDHTTTAPAMGHQGEAAAQRRPIGVLLIEDAARLRRAIHQGLTERGFAAWACADGREAIATYLNFASEIDIVLSDVQMPVLDGPETLSALREIDPSIRVCLMTGDARDSTHSELLRLGAVHVFQKPLRSLAEVFQILADAASKAAPALVPRDPHCEPLALPLSRLDSKEPAAGMLVSILSNLIWRAAPARSAATEQGGSREETD